MRAVNLRTEYLKNPLAISEINPRFYWQCEDGITQTAYEIIVERNDEVYWDSGKVTSGAMAHIRYEGRPLKSRDNLHWRVCLWDENGVQGEWSEGTFGIGLLEKSDWKAKWIAGDYKPKKKQRYPVDCFQKKFTLPAAEIRSAVLYAAARGVYDVTINGKRIEDFILAPGVTDYRKRIQYQAYDVGSYLQKENTIELRLADGWFRGSVAAYGVTNVFGTQISILAQLEITFADGKSMTVGTDESFSWSNDGPIMFADLKDGEVVDANRTPSYKGKAKTVDCDILPTASDNVAVMEHEHFTPELKVSKTGKKVLDFGQNIAGYVAFQINARKGQRIKLTLGEILDADGNIDLSGIQESKPAKGWSQMSLVTKLLGKPVSGEVTMTPLQQIVYTCSDGVNHYKTSFSVFGFRYAQVEADMEINPQDFTSIAVYSDMEQTGEFSCSNEMVNQLVKNTRWSMKGNFLDIPTDCPTRERLGWTGDAQIFFDTGAYLMDIAAFFRKWLRDMADDQYDNGLISAVIPYQGVEMMYKATGSSVGWADAVYLIPYRFYRRYGDETLLKECWPMIKKYADYLFVNLGLKDKKEAEANPHNAYTYEKGVHLGEWLEPVEFRDKVYGVQGSHPEECTAYLHYTMKIVGEIATLMGDTTYAKKCEEYANGSKKAYHALIVEKGFLDTDRQAKLVRPLALGLLDEEDKKMAEGRLVQAIQHYNYCVGTGFLSTPFILPVLTDAGETDTAYKMLENTKAPGWLSEVTAGATTIWESWEGDASRNHYSPGAVCQWLFETVAGVRADGKQHFTIAPIPGGNLTFAGASYQSIYGKVESRWELDESIIRFHVAVPSNTTAKVILPDGTEKEVAAGTYDYEVNVEHIKRCGA